MTTEQVDNGMKDAIFHAAYIYGWERDRYAEYWQGLTCPQKLAEECAPDWNYSVTFHRWGAIVTLADGWTGYTWPIYYYTPEK